MRPIGALVLAIAFTWLTGCSNALYFYETEKIAMSLKGRPDSSQPVQRSLGLKQRVAVVVPPEDPDTVTKAKGEALSMISSFRFRKDPGQAGRFDIGPVAIQTAFMTGKAAKLLEPTEAEQIAQAIAQAQVVPEASATEGKIADGCNDRTDVDQRTFEDLMGAATFTVPLCKAVKERLGAMP